MLKNGIKGPEVKTLQEQLNKLGFKVEADGDFGKNTEAAVKTFQKMFNYTVDGVVGPGTTTLITQQIGAGWNMNNPNAVATAAASNPNKS